MVYLAFGLAVVAWMALMGVTLNHWMDSNSHLAAIPFLVALIITFAGVAYFADQLDNESPCVQYEQRMMYNVATKTMMPVRVCVERGEWVE